VVSTSATATISSSLSASSVGFNGTFTVAVSTTGAGSKSSGGMYTPQASSFISSDGVEIFLGLLGCWLFLLPWEAFCDWCIIGVSMNWYAALLNKYETNLSIYPYMRIPTHNLVTQVEHWGRELDSYWREP
jgi:hypothetical protein